MMEFCIVFTQDILSSSVYSETQSQTTCLQQSLKRALKNRKMQREPQPVMILCTWPENTCCYTSYLIHKIFEKYNKSIFVFVWHKLDSKNRKKTLVTVATLTYK